jgi:hypothetical protein
MELIFHWPKREKNSIDKSMKQQETVASTEKKQKFVWNRDYQVCCQY